MFSDILQQLFGDCTNPVEYVTVFLFLYMIIDMFIRLVSGLLNAAGAGKR